jgi:excisionase family DNA binding protein
MTLTSTPTLDDLAADPAKATALPPETRQVLTLRAVAALAALAVAPAQADPGPDTPDGDRLLDVDEAARRLGVSPDWLYRRVGKLPFIVRLGRTVRCSAAGIDRYIRQRAGR